jgi:hypothetical protein
MKRLLLSCACAVLGIVLVACVGASPPHFYFARDPAVASSLKTQGLKGSVQPIAKIFSTYCTPDGRGLDPGRDNYECGIAQEYLAVALYLSGQYAQALPMLELIENRNRAEETRIPGFVEMPCRTIGDLKYTTNYLDPSERRRYSVRRMIYLAAARSGNRQVARQWFATVYICDLFNDEKQADNPAFIAEFLGEAKAQFGERGTADAQGFLKDVWPLWRASYHRIYSAPEPHGAKEIAQEAALTRNAQKFMRAHNYPAAYVEVFRAKEAEGIMRLGWQH